MKDLATYRAENPSLDNIPDDQLTELVYTKYSSQIGKDFDTFKKEFTTPATENQSYNADQQGSGEETSFLEDQISALSRGTDRTLQSLATVNPFSSDETKARQIREQEDDLSSKKTPEYYNDFIQRISNVDTFGEAVADIITDPKAASLALTESLGSTLTGPAIAAGATAAALRAPIFKVIPSKAKTAIATSVFALTGGVQEGAQEALNTVRDYGYDISNEDQLIEAFNNPEVMEVAKERALKRGATIGVVDAITGGTAGRLLQMAKTKPQMFSALVGESAIQASGGAGGEAAAQIVTDGELTSKGEVVLEGILELATGAPQAVLTPMLGGERVLNENFTQNTPKIAPERVKEVIDENSITTTDFTPDQIQNLESQLYSEDVTQEVANIEPTETQKVVSTPVENSIEQSTQETLQTKKDSLYLNEETNPLNKLNIPEELRNIAPASYKAPSANQVLRTTTVFDNTGKEFKVSPVGDGQINSGTLFKFPDGSERPINDSEGFSFKSPKNKSYVLESQQGTSIINPFKEKGKAKKLKPKLQKELEETLKLPETGERNAKASQLQRDITAIDEATKPSAKKTTPKSSGKTIKSPKAQKLVTPPVKVLPSWDKVPNTGDDNVFMVPLTPNGQARYKDVVSNLEQKLSNIAGKNVKFEPVSLLQQETDVTSRQGNFLRGLQVGDVVYVALDVNDSASLSQNETLLHEAYHILKDEFDVLSSRDKSILKKSEPQMRKALQDMYGLNPVDIDNLSQEGPSEIEATLFGLMMTKGESSLKGVPKAVTGVFRRIKNFLGRLQNALNGLGFKTYEDIFSDINQGDYNTSLNVVRDYADKRQLARAQKMRQDYNTRQEKQAYDVLSKPIWFNTKKFTKALEQDPTSGFLPALGRSTQYLRTMTDLSRASDLFAIPQTLFKAKAADKSTITKMYNTKLLSIFDDPELFQSASTLLDQLKQDGQNIVYDEKGFLIYKDPETGEIKQATRELTEKVTETQSFFKQILRDNAVVVRSLLRDYDINPETPLKDLIPLIAVKSQDMSITDKNALNSIVQQLQELEGIIGSNKAYIPYMRKGDYGITATSPTEFEEGTKKPKVLHFETFQGDIYGNPDKKEYDKIKAEINQKYPDANISSSFKLTHNEIMSKLGDRFMTVEMLNSLYGSGKDKEYADFLNKVKEITGHKGLARHFLSPKLTSGYSTDWHEAFIDFGNGASQHLVNLKYSPAENKMQAVLSKTQPKNSTDAKLLNSFVDDNLNPKMDMAKLRAFNYMWTMGLNFSTAALQLMTLPTNVVGYMMQFNSNMLKNNLTMADATRLAWKFKNPEKIIDDTYMNNLVKNGTITPELKRALQQGYQAGFYQAGQAEDYLGVDFGGYRQGASRVSTGFAKFADIASAPTQATEHYSRISAGIAFFNSLGTDRALNKALKAYSNVPAWQAFYEQNRKTGSKEELRALISLFAVEETHGVFGKEGRNVNQRGIWGSIVFPFATFTMNTLELQVNNAVKRGRDGRLAAAYTLGMYIFLAGAMGIPGWEFIKEIYEMYNKSVKGVGTNLDKDLREAFVEYGIDPETAMYLADGGFMRYILGADVGSRIGMPIFGTDLLTSLIKGEDVRDTLGVAGSVFKTGSSVLTGELGNESALKFASEVSPVAFRNFLKSFVFGHEGASSKSGTRFMNSEEFETKELIMQSLGVRPSRLDERQELHYYSRLEGSADSQGKRRFADKEARLQEKIILARRRGDYDIINKLRKDKLKVRKDAINWARENSDNYSLNWLKGYNKMVQDRVQARLNPDKAQRLRSFQSQKDLQYKFNPSELTD